MTNSLRRDAGFYLFSFEDEYGNLFKVHGNTVEEAESKLADILNMAGSDPRRGTHWQAWPANQPGDAFKYGKFRKLVVSPREIPDPFIRPVQK